MAASSALTTPTPEASSLRFGRAAERNLVWAAIGISILLHLAFFGAMEIGLMDALDDLLTPGPVSKIEIKPQPMEVPLVYVDVDPANASEETPEDTPFYSARNSLAANPNPTSDGNLPKIEGEQSDYIKTEDVPMPNDETAVALPQSESQPIPPETQPAEAVETPEGDLLAADPQPDAMPDNVKPQKNNPAQPSQPATQPKPIRPRNLVEARILAGEKMRLDEGASRQGSVALFDVKGTSFGVYDEILRISVQQRWYALLNERNYAYSGSGKVVVSFRLHSDGRVTNAVIESNDMDTILGYLCVSAIEDPSPYRDWPADMRRMVGEDWRDLKFRFFYR